MYRLIDTYTIQHRLNGRDKNTYYVGYWLPTSWETCSLLLEILDKLFGHIVPVIKLCWSLDMCCLYLLVFVIYKEYPVTAMPNITFFVVHPHLPPVNFIVAILCQCPCSKSLKVHFTLWSIILNKFKQIRGVRCIASLWSCYLLFFSILIKYLQHNYVNPSSSTAYLTVQFSAISIRMTELNSRHMFVLKRGKNFSFVQKKKRNKGYLPLSNHVSWEILLFDIIVAFQASPFPYPWTFWN